MDENTQKISGQVNSEQMARDVIREQIQAQEKELKETEPKQEKRGASTLSYLDFDFEPVEHLIDTEDFIEFLNEVLRMRKHQNRKYTITQMGEEMGVDQSTMSRILLRKRPVSIKNFERMVSVFDLSQHRIDLFRKSILRTSYFKESFVPISVEEFEKVSDWYHLAILSMVDLKSFRSDVNYISHELQIDRNLVINAIDNLVSARLLQITEEGKFVTLGNEEYFSKSDKGLRLIEKRTRQIFDHSMDKLLESKNNGETLVRYMVIPVSSSDVEKYKSMIKDTFTKIYEHSSKSSNSSKDQVYGMTTQLFPFTEVKDS